MCSKSPLLLHKVYLASKERTERCPWSIMFEAKRSKPQLLRVTSKPFSLLHITLWITEVVLGPLVGQQGSHWAQFSRVDPTATGFRGLLDIPSSQMALWSECQVWSSYLKGRMGRETSLFPLPSVVAFHARLLSHIYILPPQWRWGKKTSNVSATVSFGQGCLWATPSLTHSSFSPLRNIP